MGSLDGKCALVTGSTKGIGFATVRQLHDCGATVVIHGRTPDTVADALRQLGERNGLIPMPADLSTPEGCSTLLAEIPIPIDILVNNCGVYEPCDWMTVSPEFWDRTIALNALSGYYLAASAIPRMMDRGWGRCVFVSSETAFNPSPALGPYAVTKAMQLTMTRLFACHAAAAPGVTVNAVIPGPTATEGQDVVAARVMEQHGCSYEQALERILATRPPSLIQRMATVDEVASLICYLSSPQASATTAAAVAVDGGISQLT